MAAALRAAERNTGAQRKTLVNEALRRGLRDLDKARPRRRALYRTEPVNPGRPAVTGIHSVHDLIAFAEGEDFR